MASGRLGNCLIPPYSSSEIYHNNSGSSASISIATQVIDPNTNSEISTNIGTASTTLTATTTLTTGGCYCRMIGYNVNESNKCYYGAFSGPTTGSACTWSAQHISSDGTATVGFTTSNCCCISFGGTEIVNPTLRIDCEEPFTLPYNCITGLINVLGIVPIHNCSSPCFFLLTEYTTPTEECAGKTIVNSRCNSLFCNSFGAICCSNAGQNFDYYALGNLSTYSTCSIQCCSICCCVCSCAFPNCCNIPAHSVDIDPTQICFGFICAIASLCQSGNACCYSNICVSAPIYINTCCNSFCVLEGFGCTAGGACEICYCTNSNNCRISPFGVYTAMTKDVVARVHSTRGNEQKYLLMPTNPCLYATASCTCHNSLVDLYIANPDLTTKCELAVKYLSYNPNSDCVYIMSRSTDINSCGIFSIDLNQLCSCYGIYTGGMCCLCVSCLNFSATQLFCRVSDFPTAMTCSYYINPFMCVSCLFRFASNGWSMSLYNCCSSAWDTFVTDDLINWCSTISNHTYKASDTLQIASNTTCVVSCCNCFMSNVDYSGMIDYKVSANNYERTGVVISDGDRINVNNNSSKCMSAQVWGYEG